MNGFPFLLSLDVKIVKLIIIIISSSSSSSMCVGVWVGVYFNICIVGREGRCTPKAINTTTTLSALHVIL